jgi:predicted 2-oxoglutarate/Fe(II)-dependent dioxygenase YbiX
MGVPIQLFDLDQPFAWEVPDVFTPKDCSLLLSQTQGKNWLPGKVNAQEGRIVRTELRDADVCFWQDASLATSLLSRLGSAIPQSMRGNPLVHIRASLRVYRYGPGQFFGPHRDQKYREDGLISHLALLIYLDHVEEGGATFFPEVGLRAIPRPGLAVLFQNFALHEGEPVVRGQKHVLRADVMYREP